MSGERYRLTWGFSFVFDLFEWMLVSSGFLSFASIPLNGLTPPPSCACPNPGDVFSIPYVMVFSHVQWFEMRSGCLFCYGWNCLPSLFKLSFHNAWAKLNFWLTKRLCIPFNDMARCFINNQLVEFTSSYSVCWYKLIKQSSN